MDSNHNLYCRFNAPGAQSLYTAKYESEFNEFAESDEEAAELMEVLIERAETVGLGVEENKNHPENQAEASYRSPIGERAMRQLRTSAAAVPWCGELLVEGGVLGSNGPYAQWRAYFFDLVTGKMEPCLSDWVLFSSVKCKGDNENSFKSAVQDNHIVKAIDAARSWVKQNQNFRLRELGQAIAGLGPVC